MVHAQSRRVGSPVVLIISGGPPLKVELTSMLLWDIPSLPRVPRMHDTPEMRIKRNLLAVLAGRKMPAVLIRSQRSSTIPSRSHQPTRTLVIHLVNAPPDGIIGTFRTVFHAHVDI